MNPGLYQVGERTLVSFSRLYPVPDVEEFTIGRRADATGTGSSDPGAPWNEEALARLASQENEGTLALLDLCSAEHAVSVGVKDIAATAGITTAQVRAHLAGLTMRLKNPKYGFAQNAWPAHVTWLPGGVASYSVEPVLASIWRELRGAGSGAAFDEN
jgi:hypothetical protein